MRGAARHMEGATAQSTAPAPTILCPLTSYPAAERALPSAHDAAHLLGSDVLLFSAVEDPHMIDRREQYLQDVADRTRAPDAPPASVTVVADPHAPPALGHAASSPKVLTVMATSSMPLMHTGYVGSAAERVMREAYHPVILLGPHASTRLGDVTQIVVPCDGSPLSEHAVSVGKQWADRLDVPLWVVTVISLRDMRRPGFDHDAETNYVRRLAVAADAQWEVLRGDDTARTLTEWAGPTSLITMTTHGRSGFSRFKLGSVTVGVARWSEGPVMVTNGAPAA